MNAYGQACDIGYQHHPPVGARLVGIVTPFQNQPEHQSRQETGKGVYLCLDSREPEGVAEGIGQSTHHTTSLNGDGVCHSHTVKSRADEFSGKVGDGKEQEEDAACTQ